MYALLEKNENPNLPVANLLPPLKRKNIMIIKINEVGTRDGLQSISTFIPTAVKTLWLDEEHACGVREIEVCSFVPPKLIPQFSDATDVVEHAKRLSGLTVSALVPNLKGAQRALELGVDKINYVLSVSESHNLANVRRTTKESVADFERIVALVSEHQGKKPKVVAGLSTALGCTIEGKVTHEAVRTLALLMLKAGADEMILADTVGYADPKAVKQLFQQVKSDLGPIPITAHFHDTRALGLANVCAALEAGIDSFDASLAGLGGCPYAPGASGNIATEDLVFMLESMGLNTGIDLTKLIKARQTICQALGDHPYHGTIAKAGLPIGFELSQSQSQSPH